MKRYFLFGYTKNIWSWNGETWAIIKSYSEFIQNNSPYEQGSLDNVLQHCKKENHDITEISEGEAFLEIL